MFMHEIISAHFWYCLFFSPHIRVHPHSGRAENSDAGLDGVRLIPALHRNMICYAQHVWTFCFSQEIINYIKATHSSMIFNRQSKQIQLL